MTTVSVHEIDYIPRALSNKGDNPRVKSINKMAEERVSFIEEDLPVAAFPKIADIRRQGKLCDVTLKVDSLVFTYCWKSQRNYIDTHMFFLDGIEIDPVVTCLFICILFVL